ncbi:MAG: hypothetical protein ABFC88_12325 [Thermoguttaceae bacterium]
MKYRNQSLISRIVTAAVLVAFAIALGQYLSKPPVTAAPPPKYEKVTPKIDPKPVDEPTLAPPRGPISFDELPNRSEIEVTVEAVVAPLPKEAAPEPAQPCGCQPTYQRRGLFRWR